MLGNNKPPIKYDFCGACTFFLGAITVNLVVQALAGFVFAGFDVTGNGDWNTAFMIVIQCAFAAFIYLFTKINAYKFDFTFFNDKRSGKSLNTMCFIVPIVAAAVLLIGMYLPTVWYGYFTVYGLGIPADYFEIHISTVSSVVMLVIASVFLAPICEEIIYRGVLFGGLKNEMKIGKALALSAFAFMIMHMSPAQVVFQFALGIVSAALLFRSGRLLPSILLHATSNALALIIEFTPLGGALAGAEAWLVNNIAAAFFITLGLLVSSAAILFALIYYAFRVPKEESNSVADNAEGEQVDQEGETAFAVKDKIVAAARKRTGVIRYWLAVGICGLMFILNLAVGML